MKKLISVIDVKFHDEAKDEFIVGEFLTEDGVISKIISMNDVLVRLINIPPKVLSDKVLLDKGLELMLNQ